MPVNQQQQQQLQHRVPVNDDGIPTQDREKNPGHGARKKVDTRKNKEKRIAAGRSTKSQEFELRKKQSSTKPNHGGDRDINKRPRPAVIPAPVPPTAAPRTVALRATAAHLACIALVCTTGAAPYASLAVQFHPNGGQSDFASLPARTLHVGPRHVCCLTAQRNQGKCPPLKY